MNKLLIQVHTYARECRLDFFSNLYLESNDFKKAMSRISETGLFFNGELF